MPQWKEHRPSILHSCQILQIHLVDDSWARWNNPHVVKGLRAPLGLRNGRNTVNARHTFMQLTSPSRPTRMKNQSMEPSSARTFKNSNRSLFLSNSKSWFFFKLSALSKRTTKHTFCHKGGVICMCEVLDISPGNLDSSLWFIQPGILHDVFCI